MIVKKWSFATKCLYKLERHFLKKGNGKTSGIHAWEFYHCLNVGKYDCMAATETQFILKCMDFLGTSSAQSAIYEMAKNLDSDDRSLLQSILSRIVRISEAMGCKRFLPIFTATELSHIRENYSLLSSLLLSTGNYSAFGYLFPTNKLEVGVMIEHMGLKQLRYPGRIKGKDVIDAGAYFGDSSLIFKEYGVKRVYAFEPVLESFAMLKKTIELNLRKDDIIPVQLGLGATNMHTSITNKGAGSSLLNDSKTGRSEKIQIVPLDAYVKEHNITVGLIKVDVEGAEMDLLRGSEQVLRDQKPTLLISLYHRPEDLFYIKPWLESLNVGYRFKLFKPLDGRVLADLMLIAESEQ